MTHPDFPDAPDGSYVSEEGWLIIGDEAWTRDEWQRNGEQARPLLYTNDPDVMHRRKQWRESKRRKRAVA